MFNHRKFDRKINARIRLWNKDLEQDPLWKGRFFIREKSKRYYRYKDGSGFEVLYIFALYDKKKNIVQNVLMGDYDVLSNKLGSWKFFMAINDFITKIAKVWKENPKPSINNSESWVGKPFKENKDTIYYNNDFRI